MEILAPAGDFKCLEAAILNGADAVYVGGSKFSARKSAANFSDEELKRAVDFCHMAGAKIYVAINILIKENEYKEALSFLEYIREIGADAVIVQDLGLMAAAHKSFPDLKINASTQLTVHSISGIKKVAQLGAKRVVLAREMSFDEIKKAKEETDIELEVFAHGALCMSYSGQCLMSSIIGGRSGNRGACAQPCRLPYRLISGNREVTKTMPLLSPKDLCLIKRLGELNEIGVTSLKIEGRMKSPEYVGLVTRVYKETQKYGYNQEETEKMLAAFSRGGSSEGYFFGKSFDKMMDYKSGAKVDKTQIAEFKGKEIKPLKRPLEFNFFAAPNEEIMLTAKSDDICVTVKGPVAETAQKVALDKDRATSQLEKLGQTSFYAEKVTCDIGKNTAVSISSVNELRRQAVDALEEKICDKFRREPKRAQILVNEYKKHTGGQLTCEVMSAEQAQIAKEMGIKNIYVPISERGKIKNPDDFIFMLPAVIKDGEMPDLSGIKRICAQNIGQLDFPQKTVFAGHRLNIFNKAAIKALEDSGAEKIVLSPELNLKEVCALSGYVKNTPEVIAYGRLPLMITENCLIKSAYKCTSGKEKIFLKDRMGEEFPVVCENCRNIILNSKVIFMADRIDELKSTGADFRLMFTTESADETKEIILKYKDALSGKKVDKPDGGYTRGHFARGVS